MPTTLKSKQIRCRHEKKVDDEALQRGMQSKESFALLRFALIATSVKMYKDLTVFCFCSFSSTRLWVPQCPKWIIECYALNILERSSMCLAPVMEHHLALNGYTHVDNDVIIPKDALDELELNLCAGVVTL